MQIITTNTRKTIFGVSFTTVTGRGARIARFRLQICRCWTDVYASRLVKVSGRYTSKTLG